MPQDLIDRVTDPEFQVRARQAIAAEKDRASFLAGARQIGTQGRSRVVASGSRKG